MANCKICGCEITEDNKCSCNESCCCNHCECDETCECGCKSKSNDSEEVKTE